MYPMKLQPPVKDYLWGGNRLTTEFGKQSPYEKTAESWELSCHPDGLSVIANGDFQGKTLQEYISTYPNALGRNCTDPSHFPVLIKLIDAHDRLSVQVHPDNDYARRVEGEDGKTELWYIVDCEEGAELLYGFERPVTREEFLDSIKNNTLLQLVKHVPVHPGDVFFIPAGTLHAIGKGILIAEIQQNSNTTYRVYDYDRRGADGRPRPLHVEKAADVTSLTVAPNAGKPQGAPEQKNGYCSTLLSSCDYFNVTRLDIETHAELIARNDSFHALQVLDSPVVIEWNHTVLPLAKGDTVFFPAGTGTYRIAGKCTALLTKI